MEGIVPRCVVAPICSPGVTHAAETRSLTVAAPKEVPSPFGAATVRERVSATCVTRSRHKTIAHSAYGVDVARGLGIRFELLTQPGDMHVDGARVDAGLIL